jgi:elongation factor P--beta-lysine ligase
MERQELDANIVDIDVETIHFVVALDDHPRQVGIAIDQGFDRLLNLILDEATHVKNLLAEFLELLFVSFVRVFRGRGHEVSP